MRNLPQLRPIHSSGLTPSQRYLWLLIDEIPIPDLSHRDLSIASGASIPTISRWIQAIETAGWLHVDRQKSGPHHYYTTESAP